MRHRRLHLLVIHRPNGSKDPSIPARLFLTTRSDGGEPRQLPTSGERRRRLPREATFPAEQRHGGRGGATSRRRRQQGQGVVALSHVSDRRARAWPASARRHGRCAAYGAAARARLLHRRHSAPFPSHRNPVTSPRQRRAAQRGQGGAVSLFLTNPSDGRGRRGQHGDTVVAPLLAALGPLPRPAALGPIHWLAGGSARRATGHHRQPSL